MNTNNPTTYTDLLFSLQDKEYKEFHSRLMPTINPDTIIGVRTPALRTLAKEIIKEGGYEAFLSDLPHKYYEENNLHSFIIESYKDYDKCIEYLDRFLPYVDNWATCDMCSPKVFNKNHDKLADKAQEWINSTDTYTIRFGIEQLMSHYLDEDFDPKYLEIVAKVKSEEYYIKMMIAWYFATALYKQWDSTISYFEKQTLDNWTHNKALQKGRESNRISKEQKDYLNTLKIKK